MVPWLSVSSIGCAVLPQLVVIYFYLVGSLPNVHSLTRKVGVMHLFPGAYGFSGKGIVLGGNLGAEEVG